MGELAKFISALESADTVICESQGAKIEAFKTKEIYESISKLYARVNAKMVRGIDKSSAVWFGKCPNCGKMIVKTEDVQMCSNISCKIHVIWE